MLISVRIVHLRDDLKTPEFNHTWTRVHLQVGAGSSRRGFLPRVSSNEAGGLGLRGSARGTSETADNSEMHPMDQRG